MVASILSAHRMTPHKIVKTIMLNFQDTLIWIFIDCPLLYDFNMHISNAVFMHDQFQAPFDNFFLENFVLFSFWIADLVTIAGECIDFYWK